MTHGYEGRLGMELINRSGFISHIDSSYNSDGNASWISMTMGVNPDKFQAVRSAFEEILEDLSEDPPAEQELAEAKQHLIGRRISADQSNEELSAFYAREWIEQGRLADQREFEKKVRAITGEEVRKIIPQFLHGVTVTIDTTTHPEERLSIPKDPTACRAAYLSETANLNCVPTRSHQHHHIDSRAASMASKKLPGWSSQRGGLGEASGRAR